MTTREPRGEELINRYKNNYHISYDVNISEEMILKHWELEKRLTKQLLESTHENRWKTFDRCYTKLYSELDWLNRFIGSSNIALTPAKLCAIWPIVIGEPPKSIYEIGSGKGGLISYLATCGYDCKGTEITRERGKKHVSECSNLSWGISDGVHLTRFERADTYDVVVSNQVIEHIHPDDLVEHFKGVRSILIDGGRYIFATPHKFVGPSDISRVFKCDKPMGMHLKEYSYQEIRRLLIQSGFNKIFAVWRIPERISRLFDIVIKPKPSHSYFSYLCMIEKFISLLPKQAYRRKAASLSRLVLFVPSIFVIAQK
ncbi:MAG: methyltransferase domain-containing protein [Chloroflexota bacterium]